MVPGEGLVLPKEKTPWHGSVKSHWCCRAALDLTSGERLLLPNSSGLKAWAQGSGSLSWVWSGPGRCWALFRMWWAACDPHTGYLSRLHEIPHDHCSSSSGGYALPRYLPLWVSAVLSAWQVLHLNSLFGITFSGNSPWSPWLEQPLPVPSHKPT